MSMGLGMLLLGLVPFGLSFIISSDPRSKNVEPSIHAFVGYWIGCLCTLVFVWLVRR